MVHELHVQLTGFKFDTRDSLCGKEKEHEEDGFLYTFWHAFEILVILTNTFLTHIWHAKTCVVYLLYKS